MTTPHPESKDGTDTTTRRDVRRAASRTRIRRAAIGAAAVVALVAAGGTVVHVATAASSPSAPRAADSTLAPPAVPQHSAYLGAFVAPHLGEDQAQADVRQELAQLGNFDGAVGRSLGLVHVYQPWASPVRPSTLAAVAATGATPFIDWTCTSDASIINGNQDALITSYAQALKSFGRPVFLRWFWEMNLVNLPRTSGCLGTLGASGYIQAWQHIWTIFQNQGAGNVAFVWCPSINGATFGSTFYPGDSYVDWIGWDGYDRKQSASATLAQFTPFYANWVTHGKPLVLGETGATTDQATYLAALATALPTSFPQVRAVLYYDSKSTLDWTLVDAPGNLGADQFAALAQNPYFGFPFVGT
jgi:hypothetical protein